MLSVNITNCEGKRFIMRTSTYILIAISILLLGIGNHVQAFPNLKNKKSAQNAPGPGGTGHGHGHAHHGSSAPKITANAILPSNIPVHLLAAIPVLHDGRHMPLDTLARDLVQSG